MISIPHVTLEDHDTKGSCDFIARNPSRGVTILLGLVVIDTVVVEVVVEI